MDQPNGSAAPQRSLAHYIDLLRRNWTIIVTATAAAMILAFLLSSRSESIYVSSSTVRISDTGTSVADRSAAEVGRQLDTSVEILRSAPVRREVLDAVSPEEADAFRSFDTQRVGDTVLVKLDVRAADPDAAEAIAQQWAETYVATEQQGGVTGLEERSAALRAQADGLQTQIDDLDAQIAAVPTSPTGPTPPELTTLLSERQSVFNEQADYRRRATEFDIEAALRQGSVGVAVPATSAGAPVEPKPLRTTALAGVLGLILGIGLAILREELDTRVKGRDDLRSILPDLPVLATIPAPRHTSDRTAPLIRPGEAPPEALRVLSTNLEFMGEQAHAGDSRRGRVLVFTSPNEGDGKTTTVARLGHALAAIGRRVVLVSADLRDDDLHTAVGADDRPGIVEVVLDGVDPESALQTIPTGRRTPMYLLAGGRRPADPVDILSSTAFADAIDRFASTSDYVLIDTPPVLPVTDTLVLSRMSDAALLIVANGRTNRRSIDSAVESLRQVGFAIMGTILTGAPGGRSAYGYVDDGQGAVDEQLVPPVSIPDNNGNGHGAEPEAPDDSLAEADDEDVTPSST